MRENAAVDQEWASVDWSDVDADAGRVDLAGAESVYTPTSVAA